MILEGSEAVERQRRHDQQRQQLARLSTARHAGEDTLSLDMARQMVRHIRQAAADWRAARQLWQQQATRPRAPSTQQARPDNTHGDDRPPVAARLAQLHERASRLQVQTRRLLDRQTLTRPALAGIGMLIAVGVTALLASLAVDLPASRWTAGLIGISSIFSAGLLKWNLQHAPSHQLRQQRQRILQLVRQIEALKSADGGPPPAEFAATPPGAPSADAAPAPVRDDDPWHRRVIWSQLAAAEQRWRELLDRYDLPLDASPPRLVAHVRRRVREGLRDQARAAALQRQLAAKIAEDRAWIQQWRKRAAGVLWAAASPSDDVDARRAALAEHAAPATARTLIETTAEPVEPPTPQEILRQLAERRLQRVRARLEANEPTAPQPARAHGRT